MTVPSGAEATLVLRPGYIQKLPDGQGSIQLDGVQRWVKLQVGDTPGAPIAVAAITFAVLGLCLSLCIRPRRVWVRIRSQQGRSTLEIARLDRAEGRAGLPDDLVAVVRDLDHYSHLLDDLTRIPGGSGGGSSAA